MFSSRRPVESDENKKPSLTTIRDLVEIVAIVAAGIWASYTFVYENQIKPALSKPEMQFESNMSRLGEQNGLVAVQLHGSISNIGKTEVWLYGVAESVVGVRVKRRARPPASGIGTAETSYLSEPDWETDRPTGVFASAFLTQLADARSKRAFNLAPGQRIPIEKVFYVTARRFDQLQCTIVLRYAASAKSIPFQLRESAGIIAIEQSGPGDVFLINEESSVLALW